MTSYYYDYNMTIGTAGHFKEEQAHWIYFSFTLINAYKWLLVGAVGLFSLLKELSLVKPTRKRLDQDLENPLPIVIRVIDVILDYLPWTFWNVYDARELLEKGATDAGLPAMYPSDVEEAIHRLCDSIKSNNVQFHWVGRKNMHHTIVSGLTHLLQVKEAHRQNPDLSRIKLNQPLFVIGLPRSGTTHLHRLLSLDPDSMSIPLWLHFYPTPPVKGLDFRRWFFKIQFSFWKPFANRFGLDSVHYVRPDLPDECRFSLRLSGKSMLFWSMSPVHDYLEWALKDLKWKTTYEVYRQELQILQAKEPRKRFVLKCPSHALNPQALVEVIPEANVIFTHRNPRKLVASDGSLVCRLHAASVHKFDFKRSIKANTNKMIFYSKQMVEFASQSPTPKILHVAYSRLIKEPQDLVKDIHQFFDIPFKAELSEKMALYLVMNEQHSRGKHNYSLKNTGLTELDIQNGFERYSSYFAKYLVEEKISKQISHSCTESNVDIIGDGDSRNRLVTNTNGAQERNFVGESAQIGDIVYLTGASGFVGQMIARQCEANSTISKVYCPIRSKKGASGYQRFQSLLGDNNSKCVFIEPEESIPRDATLILLNAYNVKFLTPVEQIITESVKPIMDILEQIQLDMKRGLSQVKGISVVSTAYVQPPLPFARDPDNRVPFLLEGICSASDLYQDMLEGKTWEEITTKFSKKILPYYKKNCYASSKNIMEHLLQERYASLPICVIRPSVVAPTRDGMYGFDSRAGFPLFVNISKLPIMTAPCSEGRLNLVFVEDVATDIILGAQKLDSLLISHGGTHPILSSTSNNELTPIELFRKIAPQVPRLHISNIYMRQIVRAFEVLLVFLCFGQKRAKLVQTLYKNYDMIMSQEFDFESHHSPVASQVIRSAQIYLRNQQDYSFITKKPAQTYHSCCFFTGMFLMGLIAKSKSPCEWGNVLLSGLVVLGTWLFHVVQSHPSRLLESPCFLRYFTPFFDCLWLFVAVDRFNYVCHTNMTELWKLTMVSAGVQVLTVTRDGMYMKMFPKVIAKAKVTYQPGFKELRGALQTWISATLLLSILMSHGFILVKPVRSQEDCLSIWVEFFIMVMLNDYPLMYVLHGWMHQSALAFRYLHKQHHQPTKSCQAFDAFKFSTPDLLVQNGLAPVLYLVIKACLGFPIKVNLAALSLLAFQQIAEHSCNPHSLFFFNPILDHFFKVTIQHQLHHSVPNRSHEDVTVVPLMHLFASARHRSMLDYEKVFDVDLSYDLKGKNLAGNESQNKPNGALAS